MILIICSTVRISIWLALVIWTGLVLSMWAIAHVESAIQQCVIAAQICGLLIAGYAVARGLTEAVGEVERIVNSQLKPRRRG